MRTFLLVTIILIGLQGQAQNIISPIRSHVVLYSTPPQQIEKWSDMPIELHLSLLDINIVNATVKLKMVLEFDKGKIENNIPLAIPVSISGGEELILSGNNLSPYFLPANLSFKGFTSTHYQKNGNALPEGNYILRFEVYEYYSDAKVSRPEIPAHFSFRYAEPPLITNPNKNTVFYTDIPLAFFFRWTPRHIGISPEHTNTIYTLEISQMPTDFSYDINKYFTTFPRIFETECQNNFYYFDGTTAILTTGTVYAYRVKARCYNSAGEELIIKNLGYSDVGTFSLKDKCLSVRNIKIDKSLPESAIAHWQPSLNATHATLYFRKQQNGAQVSSGGEAGWFSLPLTANESEYTIEGLEQGNTYECKIVATCNNSTSENNPVVTFTTLPNEDITNNTACGKTPFGVQKVNDSLFMLRRFDKVKTASGLEISIEDVTGENGVFSGNGYTHIPLLANTGVKVTFKKIHVNKNYELVSGEFVVATSRRKL